VLQQAEDALKTANVVYDEAFLEPTGIKLRFKMTSAPGEGGAQKTLGDS
jgi:hypothetical protein